MRYLPIDKVKENMILGNDLYDFKGRLLISKHSLITEEYLVRLKEMGVFGLYISDKLSEGIEVKPLISEGLKNESIQAVMKKDIDSCKRLAKQIVDELLCQDTLSADMADLKTFDNYTYAHSVNVSVLACTAGISMGLNETKLQDLVLAGLLHDMGKQEVPSEILNKEGRLTPEEFALVKTHPTLSFEYISAREDISAFVKNAVLSHHENYDGSGYPSGISGDDITPMAKILHVVDVYDALTSKRPYKEPYSTFSALEIIQGGKGTQFDEESVDIFVSHVPFYPKGSYVLLNDGRKAIIVNNEGEHNLRPLIRTMDLEDIDLLLPENKYIDIAPEEEMRRGDLIKYEKKRKEMAAPVERYKIMVVDPIGDVYNSISKKLTYLYDFQHVLTDASAKGYVTKYGYPDLIIVDADSHDLSNESLLADMAKKIEENNTPIIVLGSLRDVESIQKFHKLGVVNYILKPYRIIYLQSEIKRNIQNRHK